MELQPKTKNELFRDNLIRVQPFVMWSWKYRYSLLWSFCRPLLTIFFLPSLCILTYLIFALLGMLILPFLSVSLMMCLKSFCTRFSSIIFYPRLCLSTAGSKPLPESSNFPWPMLPLSILLHAAQQCHPPNDVLVFHLVLRSLSTTLCFFRFIFCLSFRQCVQPVPISHWLPGGLSVTLVLCLMRVLRMKRWEDNIKERTGLEWNVLLPKAEWRNLVVKSIVVPQRSARLRDR